MEVVRVILLVQTGGKWNPTSGSWLASEVKGTCSVMSNSLQPHGL